MVVRVSDSRSSRSISQQRSSSSGVVVVAAYSIVAVVAAIGAVYQRTSDRVGAH